MESELPEETDLYTDKAITEIELPELLVCLKENVVKDICIDEGVPSVEKNLLGNEEADQDRFVGLPLCKLEENSDFNKEIDTSAVPISDDLKSLGFDGKLISEGGTGSLVVGVVNVDATDNVMKNDSAVMSEKALLEQEANLGSQHADSFGFVRHEDPQQSDLAVNALSAEKVMPENPLLIQESDMGIQHADSYRFTLDHSQESDQGVNDTSDEKVMHENSLLVQESDVGNQCAAASSFDGHEDQQQCGQKHVAANCTDVKSHGCEEAIVMNSMEPSAHVVTNIYSNAKDLTFNSKGESGNISLNFDSSSQMMSNRAEDAENAVCQHSGQRLSASVLEDDPLDNLTGSTRSFFIQHGHGETSFSGVGSAAGPLGYSGSVPYSGSISFRSDSSTTSTRSFAFPILHSDWNSSPVKMAKADRRHLRKHRGWRDALLCCRF